MSQFEQSKRRGRLSKYTHITKNKLLELRDDGLTVNEMAVSLGIPRGTVGTLLRTHGVSGNVRGQRKRVQSD